MTDNTGTINTLGAFRTSAPDILHTRAFVNGGISYMIDTTNRINVSLMVNQNPLTHAVNYVAMASYSTGF